MVFDCQKATLYVDQLKPACIHAHAHFCLNQERVLEMKIQMVFAD